MTAADHTPELIELDGDGGGRWLPWGATNKRTVERRFHWIQLNWQAEDNVRWLTDEVGVERGLVDMLTAVETRPTFARFGDRAVITLRGANLQPGAAPEDMISVRLLVDEHRVISLSRQKLQSMIDVEANLDNGNGPSAAGEFVAALISALLGRLAPVVADLSDDLDTTEDDVLDTSTPTPPEESLANIRRRIIALRRFVAPQRVALAELATADLPWITSEDRARLQDSVMRMNRIVEDLDAFRDRGQVIQEEILYLSNQRLNRNTFMLTVAAGILLPLNLVAGLFGMNVGGIPGNKWPYMFGALAIAFAVFTSAAVWLAWRRGVFGKRRR